MPVISFDTGAFHARMGEFRRAAQEHAGGHAVQKAANKGGADIAAINATAQKYLDGVRKFNETMAALQVRDPAAKYNQMVSDLQNAVRSLKSRPQVSMDAQSNLLSRAKVSTML
ncbi:MAG: hypothetical protein VX265_17915 [Myxococcota bacterium]|nr:hypothetical protein [Myxococcota bacterium]MEC8422416.1 hypothetical protein [Myxococcota bacterium]